MNNVVKTITAIVPQVVVGGLSDYAISRGVSIWYPTLIKPSFNPLARVFGPVWTVLEILIGVAAYVVWRQGIDAAT